VLNANSSIIQKDAVERFELLQGQSANNTSMLTTQIKDIKLYFKQNGIEPGREKQPNVEEAIRQVRREFESRA